MEAVGSVSLTHSCRDVGHLRTCTGDLPLAEERRLGRKAQYLCLLLCICVVEVSMGKTNVSISNMLELFLSHPWDRGCFVFLLSWVVKGQWCCSALGSSLGGHFLHGREWVLWLLLSHTFYQGHVKNWRQFSRSLCKAVEKPNPLFLRPFQGPLQPMRSASDASVLDVWTCLGISCGYFLI